MTKKKYAVLWRNDKGNICITLHKPLFVLDGENKVTSAESIENIPLPCPMTSGQFNTFIQSDEGKAWAMAAVQGVK